MKWLLKHKTIWLIRIFFVLINFLVFQSSIVGVFASSVHLEQNHLNPIADPYTYAENIQSVWVESGRSGGVNWGFSKDKVGSECEVLLSVESSAAKGVTNVVPRTKDVLGHIFRNAPGHVNPTTLASQSRHIKMFENVASTTKNLNPNVLTNYQRTTGGFQGFSQTYRNGSQIWVQTRNGMIINAGVNLIPK